MKRNKLNIKHKYKSDFDYIERHYNINYAILDKNKEILINLTKQACFNGLRHNAVIDALKQGKWFVFYLHKPYTDILTTAEKYKWLKFIKSIPYFKPFINISYILRTNEFVVDLEKVQAQQLFPLLVLVRALQEQQRLLLQVIKYDPYKTRSVDNITLLKLVSGLYPVYNPGHWFGNVGTNNYKTPFNEHYWYERNPIKKVGSVEFGFDVMFNTFWENQKRITKEFFNEISNEQS